jgi:hypothetical protein
MLARPFTKSGRGGARLTRRRFLVAGSALAGAVFGAPSAGWAQTGSSGFRDTALAGWARRIRAIRDRGLLPIIDLQATYIEGATNVARMIAAMDELGVAQIAFAAANAPTSAPSLGLYLAHPEHFIPTTNSGEFPRWWKDPNAFVQGVERDLASGTYFFMGEHEFRHLPSPEQVKAGRSDRDITIPLDGPAGTALFALSERSGLAFQIHYEIEDALLPALEAMLARHPKARVVWCHLAMIRNPSRANRYSPDYVASLIGQFPGLHFDLAVPPGDSIYRPTGARHSTLYAQDGTVDEKWREVIEAHPERFLASSDYRPPVENEYPANMLRQRAILASLSEPTRQLVAYGNAWRLIAGTSWTY